jgi:Tol biopolymer transport system component
MTPRSVPFRVLALLLALTSAGFARQQAPRAVTNGELPVVSPDGKRIAFLSNRGGAQDLFIIAADGTGETQLTNTPEEEGNPGWTADGKRVLFSVFGNDASRLYSIDSEGKNLREIATVPGRGLALSPDGKRLVYMAGGWTAMRLMLSSPDGSNAKQINDGTSIAWNVHWSPDGKRLAFTGRPPDSTSGLAVFVMNADGSGRRQVTHIAPAEGRAQWPVWSPDGRELAVQVNDLEAHSCHIWIVNAATGDARKLAAHAEPYLDETPSWWPDGYPIGVQSYSTCGLEVLLMNADGSGQRQVSGVK